MPRFLIDINLPERFHLWHSDDFIHLKRINTRMSDTQIWEKAKVEDLVIVTKDADFEQKILSLGPPPKVVHMRFGNKEYKEFYQIMVKFWPRILERIEEAKLIQVYDDRLEIIQFFNVAD